MLHISGLTKWLGSDRILDDIQVRIADGGVALLEGASGAGKTTLLHLIAGIDRPNAGSIFWGDNEMVGPRSWIPPWKRPISLVFQDLALWPHLRVSEHLDFVLAGRRSLGRRARHQIRNDWLERLQIGELARRYPDELSGGQRQRVSIARALVRNAELLLLDEPFSQLNESLTQQVWDELVAWHRATSATILVVSHSPAIPMRSVNYRFVLAHQHLEQVAPFPPAGNAGTAAASVAPSTIASAAK